MARLTAHWHANFKNWNVSDTLARQIEKLVRLWHVGTFIGTLSHKNEMLALFWHRQIQGGRIHFKAFPGAISTQLNHYVTPTLEEYSYDAAIIHVGINDILRSKHDELDKLPENIIKVGNTCQKFNIGKIYISAILPKTTTNINIYDISKVT